MSASITQQLDESRQKLADLRDDTVRRAKEFGRDVNQQRQVLIGRARDGGLDALLNAGATALDLGGQLPLGKSFGETLSARADELKQARQDLVRPPIENYDELNVREVGDALEGLDAWELEKVRAYEKEHKNRKTVFASIERQLR